MQNMIMDLRGHNLAPCIFFIRRIRIGAEAEVLGDNPGMRMLYGLWRQSDGTTTLTRGEQTLELRPDRVALTPPGAAAVVHPQAAVSYCAFSLLPRTRHLYPGTVKLDPDEPPEPAWAELFGRDLDLLVTEEETREVRDLLDTITLTYWRGEVEHAEASLRLGAWLCGFLLRAGAGRPSWSTDLAQRYDDLIAQRTPELITVKDLAAQLGVSTAHLSRHYRRKRGMGPGEALRRMRMAHAQEKLLRPKATVAQVARAVGYRDVSAFIRAFRQVVGEPPERWRKRQAPGRA